MAYFDGRDLLTIFARTGVESRRRLSSVGVGVSTASLSEGLLDFI